MNSINSGSVGENVDNTQSESDITPGRLERKFMLVKFRVAAVTFPQMNGLGSFRRDEQLEIDTHMPKERFERAARVTKI